MREGFFRMMVVQNYLRNKIAVLTYLSAQILLICGPQWYFIDSFQRLDNFIFYIGLMKPINSASNIFIQLTRHHLQLN